MVSNSVCVDIRKLGTFVILDGENDMSTYLKVDSLSLSWTQSRDNPQVKRLSFKLDKVRLS